MTQASKDDGVDTVALNEDPVLGHAFASRHGRIQIMKCEEVKHLCNEHLDLDVLISLPKPPPKRR